MIKFPAIPHNILSQKLTPLVIVLLSLVFIKHTMAETPQQAILKSYITAAGGKADSQRGKALFLSNFTTGKAETPSCTTCHTNNPLQGGMTRAGKPIEPMALSRNSERYNDGEKIEKWFGRNCNSVIGRDCTAQEKADFLSYMMSE